MSFEPTFDYGLSDLTKEENVVYWKFGELIKTLVTLSSNADRQIEIMGYGVVTEEMSDDFDTYFTLSHKPFLDNNLLDKTTIKKLIDLDNFLEERNGDKDSGFWDDTKLPTNYDWQIVRAKAQEILTLLGFENLDIAFERTEKHENSNKGKQLLVQTTRTILINKS